MTQEQGQLILVLDSDQAVAKATCGRLQGQGYRVAHAGAADPLSQIRSHGSLEVAVVVLGGLMAPAGTIAGQIVQKYPGVVPLVLSPFGTVEEAVSVMQQGACDYLVHPVSDGQLFSSVDRALTRNRLLTRADTKGQGDYGSMVGSDPRMHRVFEVARAVADAPTTVLMTGESGTGKTMIARAIHEQSPRSDSPFVEISCGSIPETLLESELFGHVKGAFTGAHADKQGKFQAACGGTIFLDEINSAPPSMQLKLLRVLQERVVEPVGSNTPVEVDARIILATNQPLEELVSEGSFRQDLYYRVKVIDITLPSLRERVEDIIPLSEHFLGRKAEVLGRRVIGFDEEACDILRGYHWPGNVRELENVIERAVVLASGVIISPADLPEHLGQRVSPGSGLAQCAGADAWSPSFAVDPSMTLREALETPERKIILGALDANDWNRQETATSLDINRTTLYKKMKRYGLDRRVA
ncbi:MAG: sigma-54 dependent transcriptional regulator [Phycisphaerales bacterium]|nr:sigma-54 dependent transcriptional regulator [Phycisphaerales bacterium]